MHRGHTKAREHCYLVSPAEGPQQRDCIIDQLFRDGFLADVFFVDLWAFHWYCVGDA